MKPGDDKAETERAGSDAEQPELTADDDQDESQVGQTVTDVPEKTRHRQRERRSSGAHLGTGLPLADPGHYDLRHEVARGGLGRIVAAYDTRLEREVALKELMVRHPVSEARFEREAKVTARLEHPSIVSVHDAGVWKDGQPFYAMKLVDGQSLAGAIAETDSFEERMALLAHVIDVAEAMAYAHSQRIIHHDLKPANILVGAFGETVVIDWGLAKNLGRGEIIDEMLADDGEGAAESAYHTSEGAVLGTPAYMPPEQASGEAVDERADVYALGALLYQVLVGKRPFFDVPAKDLLEVARRERPVPIHELVPEAPVDLLAIVDKAMANDPEDRYSNAGELADELHRFTTGQLVGAYTYSSKDLLFRYVRRHKRVLLTVAVSIVVLLAYGVWSYVRIIQERNLAEEARDRQETLTVEAREAKAEEELQKGKAEARARQLVVEKAKLLLATDPTAAVATLKRLDESVSGAASIAAEAQELGVARHVLHNPELAQLRAVTCAVNESYNSAPR
ncbi:MAG: serine/threonine protein kinase, partial [Deltaproteobacteria bacterium]|nr:serine/threonine protein kinase [Deltaproteobacteria bacterium]